MVHMTRTAVSLEPALLAAFDSYLAQQGYSNRSEAVRDLIREELSDRELLHPEAQAVGVVTLIYKHEELQLPHRLTELQHRYSPSVVASVHVHLDEHLCLEVVVLRGHSGQVQEVANRLASHRGVKQGKCVFAALSAPGE